MGLRSTTNKFSVECPDSCKHTASAASAAQPVGCSLRVELWDVFRVKLGVEVRNG